MPRKPAISVDVIGLDELAQGAETLTERIGDTAAERLFKVADQAGSDVRMQVPYLSGKLAGSVKAALAKSEKKSTVRIGSRVPYAGWIEFGGTRGRPYIPTGRYLFPTALGAEPQVVSAAGRAADEEIRRMRWPHPSRA